MKGVLLGDWRNWNSLSMHLETREVVSDKRKAQLKNTALIVPKQLRVTWLRGRDSTK